MMGQWRSGAAALELLARDRAPLLVDTRRGIAVRGRLRGAPPTAAGGSRGRGAGSRVTTSTSESLKRLMLVEVGRADRQPARRRRCRSWRGRRAGRSARRCATGSSRRGSSRGRRRRRPGGRASRACRPGRCWPCAAAGRRRGSRRPAGCAACPRGSRRSPATTGTGSRGRSAAARCAAHGRSSRGSRTRRGGARRRRAPGTVRMNCAVTSPAGASASGSSSASPSTASQRSAKWAATSRTIGPRSLEEASCQPIPSGLCGWLLAS